MAELMRAVTAVLPAGAEEVEVVSGGDISAACQVRVGREWCLLKVLPSAPPGFFEAEADGLRWLAGAGALAVPEVLDLGPTHLLLPWVPPGPATPASEERLGRGLARLHRSLQAGELPPNRNWIGRLRQDNRPVAGGWPDFFRERRLQPQLELARDRLGPALVARLEQLGARLPELLGPAEATARLHGDLWHGNVLVDRSGVPWLIDPAVGVGHRELDLAMMHLFGGFSSRVFAAYEELHPLSPGEQERRGIHQLYYLLVHVNLFGRGWVGRVRATLDAAGL